MHTGNGDLETFRTFWLFIIKSAHGYRHTKHLELHVQVHYSLVFHVIWGLGGVVVKAVYY